MQEVTYITSNPYKAKQLHLHLGYPVTHQSIDLPEIQSLNIEEVVKSKAQAAFELVSRHRDINPLVLVEDYSLVFTALGKLPGPLVKWFLLEMGTSGMCKLLDTYQDRSAIATSASCLYDGKDFYVFKGEAHGTISEQPRGKEVFGTDAIFIPDGRQKTWSEMTKEEQRETSVRRISLGRLQHHLDKITAAEQV